MHNNGQYTPSPSRANTRRNVFVVQVKRVFTQKYWPAKGNMELWRIVKNSPNWSPFQIIVDIITEYRKYGKNLHITHKVVNVLI